MPKNRLIYLGILIVAASALLYAGYEITKVIVWILPVAFGVGVLFIVAGIFMEANKAKVARRIVDGLQPGESTAESFRETKM